MNAWQAHLRAVARASLVVALLALAAWPRAAGAQGVNYPRVIVDGIPIHSGPGSGYRRIYAAKRGEVLEVRGRASAGYWLRVALPDARLGFVRGDAVHTHVVDDAAEADEERVLPWLLLPSKLPQANGELALMAGALGEGGLFGARVGYLLEPTFGFEGSAGVAVASSGRLVLATVGPIVNLLPSSPVQLFATLQAGIAASSPNADTFLLSRGSIGAMSGGLGLRVSLRYGLTLRVELRSHAFIEPDRYVTKEELSAGLAVFL